MLPEKEEENAVVHYAVDNDTRECDECEINRVQYRPLVCTHSVEQESGIQTKV